MGWRAAFLGLHMDKLNKIKTEHDVQQDDIDGHLKIKVEYYEEE